MDSHVTSYAGLFDPEAPSGVATVEIPLIQRDYAQGRENNRVDRIRGSFLTALHTALTEGSSLDLDFVYGDVKEGVLQPLDGQQRLTTLFLLHWYLGSRTGNLANAKWTALTYATRPSARRFCEQLAENQLPDDAERPSDWLSDRHWYLFPWRYDTTVQGMLVMLDAIHDQFGEEDHHAAWQRLTDANAPAVTFHVLPIEGMGAPDQLYIRMNARGRPLTDFENFKAQLLNILGEGHQSRDIAHRLDGRWADVMWRLRGGNNLFDNEYLRYIKHVMQRCEWLQGNWTSPWLEGDLERAARIWAPGVEGVDLNIGELIRSFEIWLDNDGPVNTDAAFRSLLKSATGDEDGLLVFGDLAGNLNLLRACCKSSVFGSRQGLMLEAVMWHRAHGTENPGGRLRLVRNLIEASTNEIRPAAMPGLIRDVHRLMESADLDEVSSFNEAQRSDEILKRNLLEEHVHVAPSLHRLEDHELLRGCVMAFHLDPHSLPDHADAFERLFGGDVAPSHIAGALLALGDYSRRIGDTKARFGPPGSISRWRELLADKAPTRANTARVRNALAELLTQVAGAGDTELLQLLGAIQAEFKEAREAAGVYDWRYYLVRYASMRKGKSGIYAFEAGGRGHSMCMLEGVALQGHYRDAYLRAVAVESNCVAHVEGTVSQGAPNGPWFTGAVDRPRWMRLIASGTRLRSVADGFAVRAPEDPTMAPTFADVCETQGVDHAAAGPLRRVERQEHTRQVIDAEDRIQVGAGLLAALVGAGL